MEPGEVLTELAVIDTRWQGVWPSKTATLSSRSRRSENSSGRQRLDGMAGLAGTPVLLEAIEASKVAICNGRFTSTPVISDGRIV